MLTRVGMSVRENLLKFIVHVPSLLRVQLGEYLKIDEDKDLSFNGGEK